MYSYEEAELPREAPAFECTCSRAQIEAGDIAQQCAFCKDEFETWAEAATEQWQDEQRAEEWIAFHRNAQLEIEISALQAARLAEALIEDAIERTITNRRKRTA